MLVLATSGLIALALGSAAMAGQGKSVRIHKIAFSPTTLQVKRGATVTWRFDDRTVSHNVTSRGKPRFRSSPSRSSGVYSVRFTRSGTYRYVCTIHANMSARIVVR